jgi:hypothetical protein
MIFIINFKQLGTNIMKNEKYSLYLNEVRKNLAANLDRSPLMRSYGYTSAGDRSTLFAIFPLTNSSGTNLNSSAGPKGGGQDARSNFVPFIQYAG